MSKFPIKTTAPGVAGSLAEQAQLPLLALAIVWSATQPERVGEVALLPNGETFFIGRGDEEIEKFAQFARRRPGEPAPTDPHEWLLTGDSISRRQLVVCADGGVINVESVGRCVMLVNGEETKRANLKLGDTLMLEGELLLLCVLREAELPDPKGAFLQAFGEPDAAGIIGESSAVWHLRERLAVAARTEDHVLLQGESGTGKELAAAAIHQGSRRAAGPFVSRNASSSTSSLLASELFGNLKNYPNPGMQARKGIIGTADRGTLFLDEIGDCPLDAQAQLLRVLDDGEYTPLGEAMPQRVDVRVVGATNRDDSFFRHDFRARFLVSVRVPPLRERPEDIPLLVRHWLVQRARDYPEEARRFIYAGPAGRPEVRISPRLIDHLVREPIPLNVRGLHAMLWVAIQGSKGDVLKLPKAFPTMASAPPPGAAERGTPPPASAEGAKEVDREPGKAEIVACLKRTGGNVASAARILGMHRSKLNRRMEAFGIESEDPEKPEDPEA